jgi:hypothetical protein
LVDKDDEVQNIALDTLLARPADVLAEHMEKISSMDLRADIVNNLLKLMDSKFDDESLVLWLQKSFSNHLIWSLLSNRDPHKIFKILRNQLNQKNVDQFESQMGILARLGMVEAIPLIKNAVSSTELTSLQQRAIAEIHLRSSLGAMTCNTAAMTVYDICAQASKNGWKAPDSIEGFLEANYTLSYLSIRRSELYDAIQQNEKLLISLQPKADRLQAIHEKRQKALARSKLYKAALFIGGCSAVFCLYMNWKPNADGIWFLGLFISVCIIAASVFALRTTSKQRISEKVSTNEAAAAKLESQIQKATSAITRSRQELSNLETLQNSEKMQNNRQLFLTLKDFFKPLI